MERWKKNPVIYEINTWVWLRELSLETGYPVTLANVPEAYWDRLMHLQIDAVWFMGVWERSPAGIEISNQNAGNLSDFHRALPDFSFDDNVGSPYCVKSYNVDQHLGGNSGLAVARSQLARRNIRIILDYVPNHLAHDHRWVTEFPEYFIRGTNADLDRDPVNFVRIGNEIFACGKDPFYPAWQDVLQVNVFHPGFREAIIETLMRVAGLCDGFRCDMAMLVMNDIFHQTWNEFAGPKPELDFWEELIPSIRRVNPDFIFIAEAYWDTEWNLQRSGFDYCYDKRLYDRLMNENASSVRLHLTAGIDFQSGLIRFTENHDEPRQASVLEPLKSRAASIITATLPGAKLFYEGQFEGRHVRVPVFLRRRPLETTDQDLFEFFYRLLDQIKAPAFHQGDWRLNEITGWPDNDSCKNLLSWQWCYDGDFFLIVVNYSESPSQGIVNMMNAGLPGSDWLLKDAFTGITFTRKGDLLVSEGLFVALDPWQFHFLKFFQDRSSE